MSTTIADNHDFGLKLCEILKLDPKKTRTITIESPLDDFVHVKVEQILQQDEAEKIIEVCMKFKFYE